MKPTLLHYYITNRCNARCSFCTIWTEKPKIDADLQDVRQNLKDAFNAGCKFVDFTGGEPLLHPQLPDFLKIARSLGFITSVTTNCLLFPQKAKELAGLVDLLHFSLDADSEQKHDQIRGVASYNKVVESIDIALANKLVPDLLYTYTNDSLGYFTGVYELARKKRLVLILDPVFDLRGPDQVSTATHQNAIRFAKLPGVYLNKAHIHLRKQGGNHTRDSICKAATSTVVILPDNSLALPCYHHRVSINPINNSLYDVLNGPARKQAIEKEGKYAFCEGCHINCYFDPSYQYLKNNFTRESMISKWKYTWTKYIIYHRSFLGIGLRLLSNFTLLRSLKRKRPQSNVDASI